MRKLRVLLLLLLAVLCTHSSLAWDFWSDQTLKIHVFNESTGHPLAENVTNTTTNEGTVWTIEFTAAGSEFDFKWGPYNNNDKNWWGNSSIVLTAAENASWTSLATSDGNSKSKINGLTQGKKYKFEIKGKAENDKATPIGRVIPVADEGPSGQPTTTSGPFVFYLKIVDNNGNLPSFMSTSSTPDLHIWGLKWTANNEVNPLVGGNGGDKDHAKFKGTYISEGQNAGFFKYEIADGNN